MIKSLLFITFISFAFSSCIKTSVDNTPNNPGTDPVNSYNVNKTSLLQLVNSARTNGCNCGNTFMPPVATVTWNDNLAKAAYSHSSDMSSKKYFDHTSPTGSTAGTRITAAGYPWKTYGENIAMGYADEQAVMNGWLSSEGHCLNIMNAAFKEIGAGREGNYWTQEFGAQ